MNLPRIPSDPEAHYAGLRLSLYLRRVVSRAPALARAFLRGLRGL